MEQGERPYKQALFRNAKFRQAVSHLYNRQKVIDDTLGGLGRPMASLVPLLFPDFIPADLPTFAYDPAAAVKLLGELGYAAKDSEGYLVNGDGRRVEFEVMTYGDPQSRQELDIFVADAKAAGVKVTVSTPDIDTLWATADGDPKTPDERQFDAFRYADAGFSGTWPFLDYMARCDGGGHYFNLSGRCLLPDEQRIAELYAQGTRELDPVKRAALGQQLNREWAQSQAMIPLITYAYNVAYDKRLGGALPRNLISAYNGLPLLPLTFVK
ncbi:ABC transporter substrate-binding protein [Deinococcus reticulitermitis]|uniref:ABC transporter substrate-binding protein n=1 Tax=Deinococcus reticulitermitis TaxID=856736 RepID=UPI000B8507F3